MKQRSKNVSSASKKVISSEYEYSIFLINCTYIFFLIWLVIYYIFYSSQDQIFSYLIVIDFESTCWREKNHYSQEISKQPRCFLLDCRYHHRRRDEDATVCSLSYSWVPGCSAEHLHGEHWFRVSHFCSAPGAPYSFRVLHRANRNYTGFNAYVQLFEVHNRSNLCFTRYWQPSVYLCSQVQVEAGIPLQICLPRFNRWLQSLQLEMGFTFPNKQQTSSASSSAQKLCTFVTWSGKHPTHLYSVASNSLIYIAGTIKCLI